MQRNSRIQRWFGTSLKPDAVAAVTQGHAAAEVMETPVPYLGHIREAMLAAVAACSESHRLRAVDMIENAQSGIELWLVRADIFQFLAQDVGQLHAAQQVAGLVPFFQGVVPAIASARKNSDNWGYDPCLH